MIDFDTFKTTIELLEKNKIRYWVFGGFALEGIRGEITRDHDDIDIYLDSADLDRFLKLFNSDDYHCYKRERMYFIESAKLKLGVVILTKEKNLVVANGNKTLAKYPKNMFSKNTNASIAGFDFRIVPQEALVLESRFSRFEDDRSLGAKLTYDKISFDKITTIKIRDSRKTGRA